MLISPSERTDPFTIQGIGQIDVQTLGGDDVVNYHFMTATRPADASEKRTNTRPVTGDVRTAGT